MKSTIIFDLGGVLIDWDPRYLYRKIFDDQEEMEYFLREVCSPAWNAQADGEKSFQDAIEELIPQFPAYTKQIQAYFSRWDEMVDGVFPETVKILEELREAEYPLAALSNWSSETFPIVNAKYEFLDWFDPLIISGKVGLIKPDPQIFNLLLCALDRDPGDCFYIDDMEHNIRVADQIGFMTVLYTTPEQLREELVSRGILEA
jgi:2-haloacid dehalogenase